jgi:hypothetical protein
VRSRCETPGDHCSRHRPGTPGAGCYRAWPEPGRRRWFALGMEKRTPHRTGLRSVTAYSPGHRGRAEVRSPACSLGAIAPRPPDPLQDPGRAIRREAGTQPRSAQAASHDGRGMGRQGNRTTRDPSWDLPGVWLAFSAGVRAESSAREPATRGQPEPADMRANDGAFDHAARNSCRENAVIAPGAGLAGNFAGGDKPFSVAR